jgi:hypothetical protein
MLANFRQSTNTTLFDLSYSAFLFSIMAVCIWWHRRLRRKWQQFRARRWPEVAGRFDEGDIVTMYKGKTKIIAGYQVWLAYDYSASGEQLGIYTLPFKDEFATQEKAEEIRKLVADRNIRVRVSPRNPKRSCVLDEDVKPLINAAR